MITIREWIEDFDNPELSEYDWHEQMVEAIKDYNEQYGTSHDPEKEIRDYKKSDNLR